MPLDYCEKCDQEYDHRLFPRCPNHAMPEDPDDYDPTDAELERYYDTADAAERSHHIEKEMRETGRR